MNRYTMGWTIFAAMFGAMCLSIGNELQQLKSYDELYSLVFIGKNMVHLGTVIGAFVGGKLIPSREN